MEKDTYILGLSCNIHQSSAAIIKNGVLLAAAEEERFSRIKFDGQFPVMAIKYCLEEAGIEMKDVSCAGFYWQPWKGLGKRLWWLARYFPASLATFQGGKEWRGSVWTLWDHLAVPLKLKEQGFRGRFFFLDHHLTHAASAFFVSGFESSAIFIVDLCGEDCTTLLAVGRGNKIHVKKRFFLPDSVGIMYVALTQYLGYKANGDEYKVMGLSSYGEPRYRDLFAGMVRFENGELKNDNSWFAFHLGGKNCFSEKFVKNFGPVCPGEDHVEERNYKDVAASGQKVLEELMVKMGGWCFDQTGEKKLCMAGGVALNSVANGKLRESGIFDDMWIQPSAYDAGCSIGCAFYIWNQILDQPRTFVMEHACWGPGYSSEEIEKAAGEYGLPCVKSENVEKETAGLICQGNVVGWFQGRMEWGPRALGNRSILADPRRAEMKDIINKKIKFREPYRPFAPSVLEEDTSLYFHFDRKSPYMLFVCPVKEEKKSVIPAVTHVDGSARAQTVSRMHNPRYWKLIDSFKSFTGVGVVLNTSFNLKGEPMVCTPRDAVRCFLKTDMDYLVMGDFICKKPSR